MKLSRELLEPLFEEDGTYDELQKQLRESEKRRQVHLRAIAKDLLVQMIVEIPHEGLTPQEALNIALDGVKLSNTGEIQEIRDALAGLLQELLPF